MQARAQTSPLPASIRGVKAVDVCSDGGGSIEVSWTKGTEADIASYNIYCEDFSMDDVTGLTPLVTASAFANSKVVTGLVTDTVGYYVAVTAKDTGGNERKTVTSFGPVWAANNVIDTSAGDEVIICGFDSKTRVQIPRGTNHGKILDIIEPEDEKHSLIDEAENKIEDEIIIVPDPDDELGDTKREFKSDLPLTGEIKITLSYSDSITDLEEVDEDKLRIFVLDEDEGKWKIERDWLPEAQEVDKENHTISMNVDASRWDKGRVYRIFVTRNYPDLENVIVYPNPYKPASGLGHDKITFRNLSDNARVKVYTVTGKLVENLEDEDMDGFIQWNAKDEDIASGLYVYLIADDKGHKKIGKLAIAR